MPKIVSETEKLKKLVSCRLHEDDYADLVAKAAAVGLTPSQYMRERLCDLPETQVPLAPQAPHGLVNGLRALRDLTAQDLEQMTGHYRVFEGWTPFVPKEKLMRISRSLLKAQRHYNRRAEDLLAYAERRSSLPVELPPIPIGDA